MGNVMASHAARELGLSARTLAAWADKGKIKSERTAGRWRVYDWDDIQRIKRQLRARAK